MKNISTGTGLCVLGLCFASYPIIDRVMPRAEAGATHVTAVVAAATAQNPPEPTIVWYGVSTGNPSDQMVNWRAWSTGRVEYCRVNPNPSAGGWCGPYFGCASPWFVSSDPAQGLSYRSDLDFDSRVDGADLAAVLNDWGDAPRYDIPPSDCPLNLVVIV